MIACLAVLLVIAIPNVTPQGAVEESTAAIYAWAWQESSASRDYISSDPPTIWENGIERTCSDCHAMFALSDRLESRELIQHTEIRVNHTTASECLTCHSSYDMDYLRSSSGEEIKFTDSKKLCNSCHDGLHAEWPKSEDLRLDFGLELASSEQCVACHNPHTPHLDRSAFLSSISKIAEPQIRQVSEEFFAQSDDSPEGWEPIELSDNVMLTLSLVFILSCAGFSFWRAKSTSQKYPIAYALIGAVAWVAAVAGQTTFLDHFWKPDWYLRMLYRLGDSGFFLFFFVESFAIVVLIMSLKLRKAGKESE